MIAMEGPLCKWTNVVKGWQYRYFTLDTNQALLSYYTVCSSSGSSVHFVAFKSAHVLNSISYEYSRKRKCWKAIVADAFAWKWVLILIECIFRNLIQCWNCICWLFLLTTKGSNNRNQWRVWKHVHDHGGSENLSLSRYVFDQTVERPKVVCYIGQFPFTGLFLWWLDFSSFFACLSS